MDPLPYGHPVAARMDGPLFARIVCGVDGSRTSREAVDQAIALAAPDAALTFVWVRGKEATGEDELHHAVSAAADAGIEAASRIRSATNPGAVLLEEAERADLLVVASHGGSRAGGIILGSTASTAVHACSAPVLVARRPPEGATFPELILVATDGSPDAHHAIELAGRIARRHHSRVDVLSVDPGPHGQTEGIAVDIVDLTGKLGLEPTVLREAGHAHDRIVEIAARDSASLIALGSRGLTGVQALGSVSERVAHEAPCSVLIART